MTRNPPVRLLPWLLTVMLVLAGCGQKGDLYLPDKKAAAQAFTIAP